MRSRKVISLLFLAACAGDPEDLATTGEPAVVGPSGTAMWNRVIAPPPGAVFRFAAVASTPDGEAVAGGVGAGTLSLGGPAITLSPSSGNDVAVARYDVDGRLVWQRVGTRPGDDSLQEIAAGAGGAIALWGRGHPDIGCGPSDVAGTAVYWVARLSGDGACVFSRAIYADFASAHYDAGGVAIDPTTGDLLVVEPVAGTLYVDGESDPVWVAPYSRESSDVVVLRFDPDGELLDVAAIGRGDVRPESIGVDGAGRVVVAGTIASRGGDVGGGPVAPLKQAAFVTSAGADLAVAWSRAYGDDAITGDLAVHPDGHLALLASFKGSVDFGNTSTSTPYVSRDLVVVKLDATGADLWNRHIWGDADFSARAVDFDPAGYVYTTGFAAAGAVRIGSFRAVVGGATMWATRLGTASGSVVWARTYGPGGARPAGLATVPDARRFYVVGNFDGELDLGDDRGPMVADGSADFLARLVR